MSTEVERIKEIRRIAVIALFSDNKLLTRLVLKGGNALDIVYKLGGRSSVDLDFSISMDFDEGEVGEISDRIRDALMKTFSEHGFVVFDVSFSSRPPQISEDMKGFWGGYRVEFKVIERKDYVKLHDRHEILQKNAIVVGDTQRRKFEIDISKHEFTGTPQKVSIDGFTVFAYSVEMIVAEKLRAICQQHEMYLKIVKSAHGSARARDFFDIFLICENHTIDFAAAAFQDIVRNVFHAKKVPLTLLSKIADEKEKHRSNFGQVKDTVPTGTNLRDYDFYFEYVVDACKKLESLWNE